MMATAAIEMETYYEQLRADLEKAIHKICPAWMSPYKDDLIQVGLMRVMDLHQKNSGKELNRTYLYKTAHSALVDEIRRLRRRNETDLVDESGEDLPMPDQGCTPERQILAREIGNHIGDCLARMITPRRLAVTLKLQGESGPQAADILGWSLRKVENLMYRGLDDLRHCLQKKGMEL